MRTLPKTWTVILCCALFAGIAIGGEPVVTSKRPLFNTSAFRPQIVMHDLPTTSDAAFVSLTGVVFSHTPLEKVTVGDRTAVTRPAEPKDLVRLQKVPEGATDAPYRTYFEVPDTVLARVGVNDVDVIATGTDGRVSNVHRVNVIRSAPQTAAK